jgi:hypothetical protein
MATITARTRSDGSISYTAKTRIRKGGIIIYQESKTFDQKKSTQKWVRQRENFIDTKGLVSLLDQMTVGQACSKYIEEISTLHRDIDRSKTGALMYMLK